ncbi:hypothetical protein MOQ_008577, partial [Trypanosoma cruzi marinkellei]
HLWPCTAPPMLHPISQIARRNRRQGQWTLSANDARLWYDEAPKSPLLAGSMRRAKEVARETCALPRWEQRMFLAGSFSTFGALLHARTTDERGEPCGLFDGDSRCCAIDRTAVRQDAAFHTGNESNPAGHGDSGVAENCGAIRDGAGVPLDRGRDGSIYPQPDRLEATGCFSTCVDNVEALVRNCGLNPQNFTMEPGGGVVLDLTAAPKTTGADPHSASRFVRIRGAGRV